METSADQNLDKVFIFGKEPLQWALNHFNNANTKIILVDSKGWLSGTEEEECMSKCARKKFRVEKQKIEARFFKQMVLELITQHLMKKFVTCADEWTESKISELLDENPSFSCKMWFVSEDEKLVSVKDSEYRKNKEPLHQQEIEQLQRTIDLLTNENEKLKLENGKLQNKLEENFNKLQETEHMQDLLVALDILTEERDQFHEELGNALKEAKESRKARENIPSRTNHTFNSEFTLKELKQATQDFSNSLKIGEGGFGCVYKGTLDRMVAIKILKPDNVQLGLSQFQRELNILRQIRHPHLVTLLGSCWEESALVYEFLPNGSLEDRLACANNTPPLTWQVRTRIIGEICLALIFLHSNRPYLVIHGDLNPNNILLDANFVSKLSDFGISRLVKQPEMADSTVVCLATHLIGTLAYCDPEYIVSRELRPKSDIYSLGIIILRLLTGTVPQNICGRVDQALNSGRFHSIIDKSAGDWPFDQAKTLAEVGLRCAQMLRNSRPNLVTGVWPIIEPLMKAASLVTDGNHIPPHFICPITKDVMKDPHLAADGFTYEAKVIKHWLTDGRTTSPMTNLGLPHHDLIPNHELRSAIQEWLRNHPQP